MGVLEYDGSIISFLFLYDMEQPSYDCCTCSCTIINLFQHKVTLLRLLKRIGKN